MLKSLRQVFKLAHYKFYHVWTLHSFSSQEHIYFMHFPLTENWKLTLNTSNLWWIYVQILLMLLCIKVLRESCSDSPSNQSFIAVFVQT